MPTSPTSHCKIWLTAALSRILALFHLTSTYLTRSVPSLGLAALSSSMPSAFHPSPSELLFILKVHSGSSVSRTLPPAPVPRLD